MRAAITGATGLLGGNLAVALCEAGHRVVATKRETSETAHLDDFPIEWVTAPLSDIEGLKTAFDGADVVFHCAAAVSIRFEIEPWIWNANVVGTQNVIQAIRDVGPMRLVHCSTVGAIGLSEDGRPSDETAEWNFDEYGLDDAYVTTKYEAQNIVEDAAADGLDAVIVNPTYMFGPYDARPSSGALIIGTVKREIPGYTLGRNNFVDVRDVARGMISAWERGRAGERYILGGHNMTYREILHCIADVADVKPPRFRMPGVVAAIAGWVGDLQGKLSRTEPLLNSATIRWSQTPRFIFRSDKAIRELDYEISPIKPAIADAISWFRKHDML